MLKHILLIALVLGSLFAGLATAVEEKAAGMIEQERAPVYDETQAQAVASEQADEQQQEAEGNDDEAMDQTVIKALPLVNVDSQQVRQVYVGGNGGGGGWGCCNHTMTLGGAHIHGKGRKFKSRKPRSLFRHIKKKRKR